MHNVARLGVLGLAALILAGCFVSNEALITPGDAARPLDGKSAYTLFRSRDGGTTWEKDQDGTIARSGDGYMLDGDPDSRFVMRTAFDTFYIAQQKSAEGFQHDLVRIEGDHVFVYGFTCGDEDQRHVGAGLIAEITADGNELQCRVASFSNLSKVFSERILAGAKPKSLYVIN